MSTNTKTMNDAVRALVAELDAGAEWPDAEFAIASKYRIPGDRLRRAFDKAEARVEVQPGQHGNGYGVSGLGDWK